MVEPGSPLGPGKIYDANGTLLESALRQAGLARHADRHLRRPRRRSWPRLLRRHAPDVDLIVTTGGVSKGAYEVVRQALAGHDVEFGAVAMQPGGPQGIGTFDGVPVLGFPGNPVSCLVSFEMFLRPVLADLFGSPAPRPVVRARLAEAADLPGRQAPGPARHPRPGRHGPAGGRRRLAPGARPGAVQRPGARSGGDRGARRGR